MQGFGDLVLEIRLHGVEHQQQAAVEGNARDIADAETGLRGHGQDTGDTEGIEVQVDHAPDIDVGKAEEIGLAQAEHLEVR